MIQIEAVVEPETVVVNQRPLLIQHSQAAVAVDSDSETVGLEQQLVLHWLPLETIPALVSVDHCASADYSLPQQMALCC